MRPIVLTIAGSDSSGGAGVQADLKAIEANGGYAATAITAITAQNTRGVQRIELVRPDVVGAQIDAVLDDLPVAAFKTGMLGSGSAIATIADRLSARPTVPLVCDPVLVSSCGRVLLEQAALRVLIDCLLPLSTVLTPNSDEAAKLTGLPVRDPEEAERAGRTLIEMGARAVLVTGGELPREAATDILVTVRGVRRFRGRAIETRHTHGTGCLLAASLATRLARGEGLEIAVERAKTFVETAIANGLDLGAGAGPADPFGGRTAGSAVESG